MTYRTDRTALARRREDLAQAVERLERKWTDIFWREVAPERGIAPPSAAEPAPDPEAELARITARLEVLQQLERDAPRIVAHWEQPPPLSGPPTQLSGGRQLLVPWLSRAVDEALARVDRYIEQDSSGVPYRVEARVNHTRRGTLLVAQLVTTVARAVPSLRVRHETLTDDLRKLFGSKHDIQLGTDAFDGVFAIEGDEATARAVLDAPTRAALLQMGNRDQVALAIHEGEARIGHRNLFMDDELDRRWFAYAVEVAGALRRAPVPPLRA